MEEKFLAGIMDEIENNPNLDADFAKLIPGLVERMTAILDRFSEPKDRIEKDVVMLAEQELTFLSSQLFAPGVLRKHTN